MTAVTAVSSNGAAGVARPPALELREVTAGYGEFTALWNVSFSVPAGSVVALIGPNGAGKTTAMRVASGLLRPAAGQVLLDGRDMTRATPDARGRAGLCLIPEGRGIYRSLTVKENLQLHAGGNRALAAIEPAIAAFPVLGTRLGQRAGSLSGGEQQMLAVSRAYLAHPRVVLLDELSMGLAPLVINEILASIDRLIKTGVSVLIVEQLVRRALEMADYAVVLVKGAVVSAGRAAEITEERLASLYLGAAP